MSLLEILLIAVGLSMDAFAVAVGKGLAMPRINYRQAAMIAIAFGLFQGGMPLLGWAVGSQFADFITSVDHWIAFALLAIIGGRMLWEVFVGADPNAANVDPLPPQLPLKELLVLAIATSIDALAAGVGFAFLELNIWLTCGLIAGITCALSFVGVLVGHRFGAAFEKPAQIAGGVILIGMGLKILLEHLGVISF